MQAVDPPELRALRISVIRSVNATCGRKRRLGLRLGLFRAILGRGGGQVVGLEQEGGEGLVGFLLGRLGGDRRGVSVGGRGSGTVGVDGKGRSKCPKLTTLL